MYFADMEKAFDRVPRKAMEWAMRKKGLPEVIVRAVINLYHTAKTKVMVGSELSEELWMQICVQVSVLSQLLFVIAMDVITDYARKGLTNHIYMQMTWLK